MTHTLIEPLTKRGSLVAPDAGVYAGVPFAEYHAWAAASNSRLSQIRRSPAHLKSYLDGPPEDTQAMLIGRASHMAVLEPDAFPQSYMCAGECDAVKKSDGKKCSNDGVKYHPQLGWLCGVHLKGAPGGFDDSRIALSTSDYRVCLSVRDAIHAHGKANRLLSGVGENELSCVWTDEASSVTCKARFDRHSPAIAGGAIVDVKTTRDASPREFERSIFSLGYHRQGAMYLDGAKANGLAAQHFVIVAVEKEAPFAVAVYRVTEGAIDAGREQLQPLLRTYGNCLALNEWPGYRDEVVDIAIPDWSWGIVDRETEEAKHYAEARS